MRILVVDDSEDGRDVADAILSVGGYMTVGAGSAREACGYLQVGVKTEEPPRVDAILLDVVMPGVDGIETCARIRGDERYRDVPIIMTTALDEMGSLASAFIAGANDYVTKPLNRTEILARVRSALRLKAELDHRRMREREFLTFMSVWVERRAGQWVDGATGLVMAEIAEAYLIATGEFAPGRDISIIALSLDQFELYGAQGERYLAQAMRQFADAVRETAANVGVMAASYGNGTIVLIVPDASSKKATKLAENLQASIVASNVSSSNGFDHISASASVVTGRPNDWSDRVHLLTRAVSTIPNPSGYGSTTLSVQM
ncbi:response regulator [Terrihabitans soli]|nr:response regulator [Terrihabitans soli]